VIARLGPHGDVDELRDGRAEEGGKEEVAGGLPVVDDLLDDGKLEP
jgi:hypothetical protein